MDFITRNSFSFFAKARRGKWAERGQARSLSFIFARAFDDSIGSGRSSSFIDHACRNSCLAGWFLHCLRVSAVKTDFDSFNIDLCAFFHGLSFIDLHGPYFGMRLALLGCQPTMLKISVLDTSAQCRLVLEGKLIVPWITELKKAWKALAANLGVRELVIDVGNLTCISREGEDALLELMRHGATFRCRGVFTKHIVQQLLCRQRGSASDLFSANSVDGEQGTGQS
jgi:hypothetical protein